MPNPKILSDLLKAAGKLPKGSPAAREAVGAKIAAEEAEKAALYKAQPIATETGRKAIAQSKQTLMTPEQQARMEAELREKGKQKFLEPSKVKERLYHGTSKADLTEFKTGKAIKEKQYPGNTIEPWAVDNRDAVFLTPSPEFSGKYSGGDWDINLGYTPTIYPVHVQVKNPWDYENPEHIENVIQAYKEKYPLQRDKSGAVPSEESLRHYRFEKNVRELPLREKDNWSGVEQAALQEIIKSLGHDAFFVKEAGIKNLGVYDPRRIKSATGNIGTYDITTPDITKKDGGLAMATGGQAFPLQEEFQAEVERRAARPRTRAGVPVEDTNVLGGALRGLANTLGGLAFGRTVGTLGMPADILEPTAATGAMIPMFGMAGMPSEISKALVQRFAPKGPDIPAPTSEYLLEKGLEKFKPPQEFEVSAKLGRFLPFDITEMQAAGRKLKALQPTFTEMMETGLERATAPARMYAAPEEGAKLSKEEYSRMMREKFAAQNLAREEKKVTAADLKPQEVKVPADRLGFYSPAEKAAANLKRNIGTGEAFLQDIKRAPDVSPDDLEFTGLERWLKGKKTVSKQEIQDYMKNNRLVLEEVEYRQGTSDIDEMKFSREGEVVDDYDGIQMRADDIIYDWDNYGYKSRDEIREEILNRYTPEDAEPLINSGQIDEMVDDAISETAYQMASDEYYDNPYRRWRNDTGYEIFGNDDVGYQIQDPRGRDITPSRGVYDFETAEGEVRQHGMDYGYVDEGETKYHDYQLPGGSNYRELLISSPPSEKDNIYREMQDIERAMADAVDQREYNELKKQFNDLANEHDITPEDYSSSHWDVPNVLAHVRLQDRVDAEGNKNLYVDEMQSDWHQEGRRYGYKTKEINKKIQEALEKRNQKQAEIDSIWRTRQDRNSQLAKQFADSTDESIKAMGSKAFAEQDKLLNELDQAYNKGARELTKLQEEYGKYKDMVPAGPFTDNWHKMALKRVMKYAADNGYTRVGFSKAQPQVNRWGTDVVAWEKVPDGAWIVTATEQRGGRAGNINLEDDARARGILQENRRLIVDNRDDLYAAVAKIGRGKSEAELQKLTDRIWKQMQEKDVGIVAPREAGMKKFYDEDLEGSLKKYANTYKGKYGQTTLDVPGEGRQTINYIDITPEVKKSTSKGQPYKTGGAVRKADGGAVHPAVEKFAASLPHPAVTEFENRVIDLGDMITGGSAVDLSNLVAKSFADGGGVWKTMVDGKYNTVPDVSDAERVIQGPAFAEGGGVWKQLVEGAGNA